MIHDLDSELLSRCARAGRESTSRCSSGEYNLELASSIWQWCDIQCCNCLGRVRRQGYSLLMRVSWKQLSRWIELTIDFVASRVRTRQRGCCPYSGYATCLRPEGLSESQDSTVGLGGVRVWKAGRRRQPLPALAEERWEPSWTLGVEDEEPEA